MGDDARYSVVAELFGFFLSPSPKKDNGQIFEGLQKVTAALIPLYVTIFCLAVTLQASRRMKWTFVAWLEDKSH